MADLKMPEINSVLVAGNLTKDPSLRRTSNGTPVANFFIASNRRFKDNTGQWREDVCYVGVVAWYKLAESCYENLKKGSAVLIDGELQSRSLKSNDGSNHNIVEIKARRIQFLDKRGWSKSEESSTQTIDSQDTAVSVPPSAEGANLEDSTEESKIEEQQDCSKLSEEKSGEQNKFD